MTSKLVSFLLVTCLGGGLTFSQADASGAPSRDDARAARGAASGRTPVERGRLSAARESARESPPPVRQAKPLAVLKRRPAPEAPARQRETLVYRLKNIPAADVAKTLGKFLEEERQIEGADDQTRVVITPDALSNTLLIRAPAGQIKELTGWLEEVDRPRPMVAIRAVIVQVRSGPGEDDGHGTPGDTGPRSEVPSKAVPEKGPAAKEGDGAEPSLETLSKELDLGALEDPASKKSVEELIGELAQSGQLEILARPQIMTLDNQAAFIQVGKRVPRVTGTRVSGQAQTNEVALENVGLILGVTPRVSDEETVVMEIDLEMSDLGQSDDVALSVVEDKPALRATEVMVTTAQTTVAVRDGQTVVIGRMASKTESRGTTLLMLVTAHIIHGGEKAAAD